MYSRLLKENWIYRIINFLVKEILSGEKPLVIIGDEDDVFKIRENNSLYIAFK